MSTVRTRDALDAFATAAHEHHAATVKGDWIEANRHAKHMRAAFAELRRIGQEGRDALLNLTDDPDTAVAIMAAVYSLKSNTQRAQTTLQRLVDDGGIVGFEAEQALKRWDEGAWQLESEAPRPTTRGRAMNSDVAAILDNIPDTVSFDDIPQFERFDYRVSAVEWACGDIVGVSTGYVEWCPNLDPPTRQEKLAWWWLVRPDLGAAIAHVAHGDLRRAIVQHTLDLCEDKDLPAED